jgi:hypothetical protein
VNKINILGIILAHFDTLRDSRGARHWPDFILFLGLPLVVSVVCLYFGWALYVDALNAMLAAFAIFAGLLLNLLILVYTFSPGGELYPGAVAKARAIFVRHLHSNLAFAVLLSVLIAVIALVAVAYLRMHDTGATAHTGPIVTFGLIFLTTNFVLTLLMVLKRIHVILGLELDKPTIRKAS